MVGSDGRFAVFLLHVRFYVHFWRAIAMPRRNSNGRRGRNGDGAMAKCGRMFLPLPAAAA